MWAVAPADPANPAAPVPPGGAPVATPPSPLGYLDHLERVPGNPRGRTRPVNADIDPVAEARRVLEVKAREFQDPKPILFKDQATAKFTNEVFPLLMPPNSDWLVQLPQQDGRDGALAFFQTQLRFTHLKETSVREGFQTALTDFKVNQYNIVKRADDPNLKPEDLSAAATRLVDMAHFTSALQVKDVQFRRPQLDKELLDQKVMDVLADAYRQGHGGNPIPSTEVISPKTKAAVAEAILKLKDNENIRNGLDPANPDAGRANALANNAQRNGMPASGNNGSGSGSGGGSGMGGGGNPGGGGGAPPRAQLGEAKVPEAIKPTQPNENPQQQQVSGDQLQLSPTALNPFDLTRQVQGPDQQLFDNLAQQADRIGQSYDMIGKYRSAAPGAVSAGNSRELMGSRVQRFAGSVRRPANGLAGGGAAGGGAVGAAQNAGISAQAGRYRGSRGLVSAVGPGSTGVASAAPSRGPAGARVATRSAGGRALAPPKTAAKRYLKPKYTSLADVPQGD